MWCEVSAGSENRRGCTSHDISVRSLYSTYRKSYLANQMQPIVCCSNDRKCPKSLLAPNDFGSGNGDSAITCIWVISIQIRLKHEAVTESTYYWCHFVRLQVFVVVGVWYLSRRPFALYSRQFMCTTDTAKTMNLYGVHSANKKQSLRKNSISLQL